MIKITAFPLSWPADYNRTINPESSPFSSTFRQARDGVLDELRKMDIEPSDIIISSNVPLRKDGLPGAKYGYLSDHGIAVYFRYNGKNRVICCDKYNRVECNLQAIRKSIEALRGLNRWGVSAMMERAIDGFEALPDNSVISYDNKGK